MLLLLPPDAAVAAVGVIAAAAACRLLRRLAGGGMLRGVNCGLGSGVPAAAAALPLRCMPTLLTPAGAEACGLRPLAVAAVDALTALLSRVPLLPCAVAGVLLPLKRRVA
jgi:hypothetical protein